MFLSDPEDRILKKGERNKPSFQACGHAQISNFDRQKKPSLAEVIYFPSDLVRDLGISFFLPCSNYTGGCDFVNMVLHFLIIL